MALKYQALNGTIINKTVTLPNTDVFNISSPLMLTGLSLKGTSSGTTYYGSLLFVGFGANETSIVNFGISYSTSSSAPTLNSSPGVSFTIPTSDNPNKKYCGYNSNVLWFKQYAGSKLFGYSGKFTIVSYNTSANEIVTEEYLVPSNAALNPSYSYTKFTLPYNANRAILSVTFEPTE